MRIRIPGAAFLLAFIAGAAGCALDVPRRYDLRPAEETTAQRVGFVSIESAGGKPLGYAEVMQVTLSGEIRPNVHINVFDPGMTLVGAITQKGEAFRFDKKSQPVSIGVFETRNALREILRQSQPIRLYGSDRQMARIAEIGK